MSPDDSCRGERSRRVHRAQFSWCPLRLRPDRQRRDFAQGDCSSRGERSRRLHRGITSVTVDFVAISSPTHEGRHGFARDGLPTPSPNHVCRPIRRRAFSYHPCAPQPLCRFVGKSCLQDLAPLKHPFPFSRSRPSTVETRPGLSCAHHTVRYDSL